MSRKEEEADKVIKALLCVIGIGVIIIIVGCPKNMLLIQLHVVYYAEESCQISQSSFNRKLVKDSDLYTSISLLSSSKLILVSYQCLLSDGEKMIVKFDTGGSKVVDVAIACDEKPLEELLLSVATVNALIAVPVLKVVGSMLIGEGRFHQHHFETSFIFTFLFLSLIPFALGHATVSPIYLIDSRKKRETSATNVKWGNFQFASFVHNWFRVVVGSVKGARDTCEL